MNWIRVSKSFSDFAAAALSNDIEIYQLPAGAAVQKVICKHTTPFGGGGIATYTMSVGIATNLVKFLNSFDVFQAVSDTVIGGNNSNVSTAVENWGATTSIRAEAVSTAANLDQANAGAIEFYILVSQPRTT